MDDRLGQSLRAMRTMRGETLADVARATGISIALLSRIERGERSPSPETVEALAGYFEIPVERLAAEAAANQVRSRWGDRTSADAMKLNVDNAAGLDARHVDLPADRPWHLSEGPASLGEPLHTMRSTEPLPAPEAGEPSAYRQEDDMRFRSAGPVYSRGHDLPPADLDDELTAAGASARVLAREYIRCSAAMDPGARLRSLTRLAEIAEELVRVLDRECGSEDDRVARSAERLLRRLRGSL